MESESGIEPLHGESELDAPVPPQLADAVQGEDLDAESDGGRLVRGRRRQAGDGGRVVLDVVGPIHGDQAKKLTVNYIVLCLYNVLNTRS